MTPDLPSRHPARWAAATRHPFLEGVRDGTLPVAALVPGAMVRLVDQDHLGVIATVREAPRHRRFDGDVLLDALVIDLPNGEPMLVPTANVEVLA